jgi:hypothetical protein
MPSAIPVARYLSVLSNLAQKTSPEVSPNVILCVTFLVGPFGYAIDYIVDRIMLSSGSYAASICACMKTEGPPVELITFPPSWGQATSLSG